MFDFVKLWKQNLSIFTENWMQKIIIFVEMWGQNRSVHTTTISEFFLWLVLRE
jgi:hypothetical protein